MTAFLAILALAGAARATPDRASDRDGASPHFAVSAEYRPGKTPSAGEVAVTFAPRDPDVKINVTPAPLLKLDDAQKVLAEKPAPKRPAGEEKYIDTTFPVVFPVARLGPAHGDQTVKGSVTYYYCSHREGWCRKGTADLEIPVKAR